jgi:predicted dehydrogenase
MKPLRLGLYGQNGHQIQDLLKGSDCAELVAVAGFKAESITQIRQFWPQVAVAASLADLLLDSRIDLISLCSPRRADQAKDAIACLQAGKHVYAEKPCALCEADLDEILETARKTGREFHEMAGTIFCQPYHAMRDVVRSGRLGKIVQVLVQKSYPYHAGRPQDEAEDGGLIGQVAIHGTRLIEHLTGIRLADCAGFQTGLGNPNRGELQMAVSLSFSLENGGCATLLANYLNPWGGKLWGYEEVRIFGTLGMVESVEGGRKTRLVIQEQDMGPVDTSHPVQDYFLSIAKHLLGQGALPLSLEEEFHPTRMVLRARQAVIALGQKSAG